MLQGLVMSTKNRTAVVYTVDKSKRYRLMALRSANMVRQFDKDTDIIFISTSPWDIDISRNGAMKPFYTQTIQGLFNCFPSNAYIVSHVKEYDSVVYLDADTFIFGSISELIQRSDVDISARLSTRFQDQVSWRDKFDQAWKENLRRINSDYVPVFNSGVIVFRNNAHSKILNSWIEIIQSFYDTNLIPVYGGEHMFCQLAFSLVTGKSKLSFDLLDEKSHAFAWLSEPWQGSIVYHTNSQLYDGVMNTLKSHVDFKY